MDRQAEQLFSHRASSASPEKSTGNSPCFAIVSASFQRVGRAFVLVGLESGPDGDLLAQFSADSTELGSKLVNGHARDGYERGTGRCRLWSDRNTCEAIRRRGLSPK